MPDYFQWPRANGKPMVFVAQMHCPDFPAGLWGGVGPREGWLLFFIAPEFQRDGHLPVKVIHTMKLGPERDDPGRVDEIEWLSYDTRKNLAGADITLPKWPVWFYENDLGATDKAEPYVSKESYTDPSGRPNPRGIPWPAGPAGNPLSRSGLRRMFENIREWLAEKCTRNDNLIETLTKRISASGQRPDKTATDAEDAEGMQFDYAVASGACRRSTQPAGSMQRHSRSWLPACSVVRSIDIRNSSLKRTG
jgi:hypothetical protein